MSERATNTERQRELLRALSNESRQSLRNRTSVVFSVVVGLLKVNLVRKSIGFSSGMVVVAARSTDRSLARNLITCERALGCL